MTTETIEEVQNLHTLTVGELKQKYVDLFGEPTRSYNKDYLRKKIAWRLQSLDEGGLSERAKNRAKELANDSDIRIRAPQRKRLHPDTIQSDPVSFQSKSRTADLLPGTTLKRIYKNQTLLVTVTKEGFLFNGKVYGSLSGIAKEVTGALWNGRAFFGITKPSKEKNGKQES